MKFTLEIELGNEGMRSGWDIAYAIRKTERHLIEGSDSGTVQDINGNTVGEWAYRGGMN